VNSEYSEWLLMENQLAMTDKIKKIVQASIETKQQGFAE
jgi:hypothetical protein